MEDHDEFLEQAECVRIAAGIVEDYLKIPEAYPRHMFPIYHYLTSATMIMLSIALKNPAMKQICRKPVQAAANALMADRFKTWVSEKIDQTVLRLSKKVRSGFLNDTGNVAFGRANSDDLREYPSAQNTQTSNHQVSPVVVEGIINRGRPYQLTPNISSSSRIDDSASPRNISINTSSHPVGNASAPPIQETRHQQNWARLGQGDGSSSGQRPDSTLSPDGIAFKEFPGWTLGFEETMDFTNSDSMITGPEFRRDLGNDPWHDWALGEGSIPFGFLSN